MPTHVELVARAAHWLRGSLRCSVIVWKKGANCVEEPDAIGWDTRGFSTLVECKTTRADFRRDAEKWHRKYKVGAGNRRYYLTLPGLVKANELPDGWGLLECLPATIRTVSQAIFRPEPCRLSEVQLLVHWNRGRYSELPEPMPPQEPAQ